MKRMLSSAKRLALRAVLLACVTVVLSPGSLAAQRGGSVADVLRPHAQSWSRLLAAEDARAGTEAQLRVLVSATGSQVAELRRLAVRGLGRLERGELGGHIRPLLRDPDAGVRAAAAHALAQSAIHGGAEELRTLLGDALETESDASVRAALAESLGRLRHDGEAEARVVVVRLVPMLGAGEAEQLGALRGFFFLARQPAARSAIDTAAASALRGVLAGDDADAESARRRVLALATLAAAAHADDASLRAAAGDPNPLVRREAMLHAGESGDTAVVLAVLDAGLADEVGAVRYEALRSYGRHLAADHGCDPARAALDDDDTHVALQAISLLAGVCETHAADMARLDALATTLPTTRRTAGWHRPAHALLALAAKAPARAATRLPAFTAFPNYFVRAHAARAASLLGDTATLHRLAADAHPNVRTAAVQGLHSLAGSEADDVYLEQLEQDDSQLLQAAAAALEGSVRAAAPYALLDALDRISAARSETMRDARRALLLRVHELGNPAHAPRVGAYLTDYDPQIAALASEVLEDWTGERAPAAPSPPRPLPLPRFDEIAALAEATMVIEMEEGGEIHFRLHAFDAPTNVARFARLARAGYYDGLTLHRVVPNFVVQGGSPNANEYAGDAPFTRDEVAVPNWRGSVGLSTRGRDTGDAQLYINTVDNVRLDHQYTIWADVVHGMDVVDGLQEGAVMRRVYIREPR